MSMRKIVLDIGSGASLPDVSTARSVVETVARANTGKHQVVLKPQLFQNIPPNKPLRPRLAEEIATLCLGNSLGYAVSVFDRVSLDWALEMHDVSPLDHIKIACRPDLYWLAGEIPRKIPVHMSFDCRTQTSLDLPCKVDVALGCVPEYPASIDDYSSTLFRYSDHTVGLDIWKLNEPSVWEKHFVMQADDPSNPDSVGGFALTPADLKDVL